MILYHYFFRKCKALQKRPLSTHAGLRNPFCSYSVSRRAPPTATNKIPLIFVLLFLFAGLQIGIFMSIIYILIFLQLLTINYNHFY